jgi:hypothetical protein
MGVELVECGVWAKVGGRDRGPRGPVKAVSVKKPPVFIGLGAVYNRNLNTLFWEPKIPGFSKDWIKNSSFWLQGLKFRQSSWFIKKMGPDLPTIREKSMNFKCKPISFCGGPMR